ncbi:unnamed protein product [Notodromas monacha]|uniref:tRNA (adenine(58)-N(1))-methyltransferase catalytic subunit TRMT61A n=1 Tax=Notodromas monacha TaxID=399045 RepID=A0A7R9GGB9_9CRUS|nr:unnamed protein product [Notodromas monacha]CAG0921662.1 unnamed protein product [Notodromas monacha]
MHGQRCIEENSVVILYVDFKTLRVLRVTKTVDTKDGKKVPNIYQTIYGPLNVSEVIGKPYGARIELKKGFVYLMFPSPELWTLALPHRTQILYSTDISLIIANLELKPGKIVCEAGTGSGSLSCSILRTIMPCGKLHTFDFHDQRVECAVEEFTSLGYGEFVVAKHRDVCQDGFGVELTGKVDAVFLDLPHPWLALTAATKVLKNCGRIASFSPCVEQVQKMCVELRSNGYEQLKTIECLVRESVVKTITLTTPSLCTAKNRTEEPLPKRMKTDGSDPRDGGEATFFSMPVTSCAGHTGFLTFATCMKNRS